MSGTSGTSLNDQNEKNKKKWGGDTLNFDINAAVNGFDANKAEYGAAATTPERKAEIDALYGGNIMNYKTGADVYADYNRDLQGINAIDSYKSALSQAQKSAQETEARKLQYADTRRQLMEKYIPETLMAQGIANTGYTADALLKAENNYNQYALGAMSERANAEQNALQSYQDAVRDFKAKQSEQAYTDFLKQQERENQQQQTESALYSNAIDAIENDATKEYALEYLKANNASQETIDQVTKYYDAQLAKVQEELYNERYNSLDTLTYDEIDRLEREGELSPELANKLREDLGEGVERLAKKAVVTDKFWASGLKGKKGDNFWISYDGKDYPVQNGGTQTGAIVEFAKKNIENGEVFKRGDKLYVYKDNNVYLVEKRPLSYDAVTDLYNKISNVQK